MLGMERIGTVQWLMAAALWSACPGVACRTPAVYGCLRFGLPVFPPPPAPPPWSLQKYVHYG